MWIEDDSIVKFLDMADDTQNKRFSANFFSLQLQFKALLEEAGGDDVVSFLDTLASLNRSEQKVALKLFSKVLKRVVDGPIRLETEGDLALKEFEDTLYDDLLEAIEQETSQVVKPKKKIEVLQGGKINKIEDIDQIAKHKNPIDLASARKKRRERRPSFIN